jgi:hypothetical protein
MALKRNGRWLLALSTMSAVFLIYWASEYLLATRPVADSVASVLHAARELEGLAHFVVIQTQIVLPAVHAICLAWLLLSGASHPKSSTSPT